jgi:putative ABC transport system ATP-binding protein
VYGRGAAEVQALRDISLTVPAGTMVAVMGPSGSGKSSLLTIAGTLEEPTSGAVLINGQDVERMSNGTKARVRRRTIGYVFQDFNLLPGLTAAENVSLPLELDERSWPRSRGRTRASRRRSATCRGPTSGCW